MMPQRVLLTGFEPFGGDTVNPSWLVAEALHGAELAGARVTAVRLPCTFADALPALDAALERVRPQFVVALGQAARAAIGIERVAINVDDARIPDNAGAAPIDEPVLAGGPAAYFSTLPVKAICAALREAGIAVEVSNTAGTFVCNHVFFGLMQRLRRRRGVRGGFIHVPLLPEQALQRARTDGMPLATMIEGVRIAVTTALGVGIDLRRSEGTLD